MIINPLCNSPVAKRAHAFACASTASRDELIGSGQFACVRFACVRSDLKKATVVFVFEGPKI
jgi:hypothetical protein